MVYIDVLGLVCKETCSILIPENTRVVSVTPPEIQRCRSTLWFFFRCSRWSTKPLAPSKRLMEHLSALPRRKNAPSETEAFDQSVNAPHIVVQPACSACNTKKPPLQCSMQYNIYIYTNTITGYSSCLKPSGLLTPFMPGFCSCLSFGSIYRSDTVELFWTTEVVLHPTTSFWNWCHPKIICFLWGTWRVPF